MTQQPQARRVNQLTGKPMGVGPFPYSFIIPVLFFAIGVTFVWMIGLVSEGAAVFLVFAFMIAFFLLTGRKPWRFYERFYHPRQLMRVAPYADWQHVKGLPMPPKMRPQSTKYKGKRVKAHPVEAEFDLVGYGTATINKPEIGFYVLHPRHDSTSGVRRQFAFVFVWEVWGYDPALLEVEAKQALDALEFAFRRMTRNVVVTFEHSSTSDDVDYQRHLDHRLEQTSNPLAKALLYSQKAKIRELRNRGALQAKRTRIFVRYQIASASDRHKTSPLDHVMGFLDRLVSARWKCFRFVKKRFGEGK